MAESVCYNAGIADSSLKPKRGPWFAGDIEQMKRTMVRSWVLVANLWLATDTAKAGTITETIRATIATGIDYDGIFGATNANLSGVSVTIQLSYVLGTGPYVLAYSALDGGYVNPYGAITESLTIGSTIFTVLGDNYQAWGIMGVDQSGIPLSSSSLSTAVGGYCSGAFYLLGAQNAEQECKDSVTVNFALGTTSGTVLTQLGSDALFSSTTGGTMTVNPYEVPHQSFGDPTPETFSWTANPEPATWFLAVVGFAWIASLSPGFGRRKQ
jgi:hypothetical protein